MITNDMVSLAAGPTDLCLLTVLLLLTFLPGLLSGGSDKEQGKRIRQDSQKA